MPLDRRALAQHLQPAVRLVGDLLDGRVVELGQRGVLGAGRDASGAAYAETLDTSRWWPPRSPSASASGLHLPREVGAGVDGRVPLAVGQRRQVAVAVAEPVLDLGEQVRRRSDRGGTA